MTDWPVKSLALSLDELSEPESLDVRSDALEFLVNRCLSEGEHHGSFFRNATAVTDLELWLAG